jgi:hypothetical protein
MKALMDKADHVDSITALTTRVMALAELMTYVCDLTQYADSCPHGNDKRMASGVGALGETIIEVMWEINEHANAVLKTDPQSLA